MVMTNYMYELCRNNDYDCTKMCNVLESIRFLIKSTQGWINVMKTDSLFCASGLKAIWKMNLKVMDEKGVRMIQLCCQ